MGTFLLIATIMVGIALVFILPPVLAPLRVVNTFNNRKQPAPARGQKSTRDREQLNITIYRERLSELARQHRDGFIDEVELVRARAEIQRAALSDLARADTTEGEASNQLISSRNSQGSKAVLGTTVFIALAIPVISFWLYFQWGSPALLAGTSGRAATAQHATSGSPGPSSDLPPLEDMVERLAARLRQEPGNPQGWLMLGRSYTVLGRIEEADAAFAEAYERQPDNPEILVSYAESLAGGNGGDFSGRPSDLIESALEIQPDFPSALWLAGVAAYQQNRYDKATEYWERLQQGARISEQEQRTLAEILSDARKKKENPD